MWMFIVFIIRYLIKFNVYVVIELVIYVIGSKNLVVFLVNEKYLVDDWYR